MIIIADHPDLTLIILCFKKNDIGRYYYFDRGLKSIRWTVYRMWEEL